MATKPERDTPGIVLAAVFILIGAVFLYDSANLLDPDSFVFPVAICVVMIVLSMAFIAWNLIRPHPDVEATAVHGSTPRRAGLVVVMLASAFVMPYVGFVVSGLGAFVALMLLAMFEPWSWSRALIYGVVCLAVVSGFYAVFAKVFLVPLPEAPFL